MGADWVSAYATCASALGTWVASVVVLVSVLILRSQLRATRRTIRSASVQGAYALWIGVDQFFVQHPELKAYFYKGKKLDDSLDDNFRMMVESAAEMILDCMANVYHQLPNLATEEREAYGNFLKERYQTQPAIRQFVDTYRHWYPSGFVTFLRSEIEWVANSRTATE